MAALSAAGLAGGTVDLDAQTVDAFADSLDGRLVTPEDSDYEDVRAIWNAMITRRPAMIAVCGGEADVQRSLTFARAYGLLFSIRGAGHNIAGSSLCDGGLTIDLSQLTEVELDTTALTVRVQPGATLGDVDAATLPHGLAVPTGINSTTGIGGLTLGGGFGWLSRKYGATIDSLISADVVTADGDLVTASADQHADLFWGLRGGGGNFGIVTSYEYQVHPAGPDLLCGLIVHPFSDAAAALEYYREYTGGCSDEMTAWAVLRDAPPLPFLPEEVHGTKVVVFAFVYAGDPAAGELELAPLRAFGTPLGEHIGVMPFAEFQQAFDPLLTPGARNYWKSHNFSELADGLLGEIMSGTANLPSPQSEIFIAQVGGALARVPSDATAYPHRDAAFVMNVHTRWEDPAMDDACVSWARAFFDATAPYATGGVYVNFVSESDDSRVQASYGSNYERLRQLKAKYDPDNVFRTNQNIVP
jgi:FAD/FMN-containing dehydrogenase